MKKSKVFEECQTIADSLGFKVIHGKGNFNGDICRLDDKKIIVLNKFFLGILKLHNKFQFL